MLARPFLDGYRGPLAQVGDDVKLVHQPLGPRQAQSQTVASRVAILHGLGDVGDAGSLVTGDDHDALSATLLDEAQNDLAPRGVAHNVACQLRNGRGDEGQIAAGEAQMRPQRAPLLTRDHDVDVRPDRHARFMPHSAGPLACDGRGTPALLPGPAQSPRPLTTNLTVPLHTRPRAGCPR